MKKWIWAISFIVVLLICCTCHAAIGESGTCGENLTWTLDDQGLLTVSGTGTMDNWGESDNVSPWFNNAKIKKAILEDGVTSIGDNAFYSCTSLTDITVPDSVAGIGDSAFYACTSLKSIAIPDGVTKIGDLTFAFCHSLESVTIPDSVTSIGLWAFSECSSLTGITIPDSVTSIGVRAFESCTSLADIVIPDSVTSIEVWAFLDCSSLTSITLPDSVTNIVGNPFGFCEQLTEIIVSPDHPYLEAIDGVLFSKPDKRLICYPYAFTKTSYAIPDGVKKVGFGAFAGSSLAGITIPESVTGFEDFAFSDCTSLESVTIPASIGIIPEWTFSGCSSLKRIAIPDSVSGIWCGAFSGCDSLADVYYSGTESAWSKIIMEEENEPLSDAKIHFNASGLPAEEPEEEIVPGDVNGDGVVDGLDVVRLMKYLAEEIDPATEKVFEIHENNADVTGDGKVDEKDLVRLVKYFAGENITLEKGKVTSAE